MANATATTLDAILKELYVGQRVQKLAYDKKARPFLSMLPKVQFSGTIYPLPVVSEHGGGRAITISGAQTNVLANTTTQFQLSTKKNYAVGRIENDAILRTRNDKGAFLSGLELEIDGAIQRLSNDLESNLFRDQSGSIGTISALSNGNKTITLTDENDIVNFYVGQELVAADTTASALRSSTSNTITAVDRDLGTITSDVSFSTAGMDGYAGDLLFTEFDYDSASDTNKIAGLGSWLPSTAPSSGDSFLGVDRSGDPTRLGGLRYTGNAGAIEESIIGASARLARETGVGGDTALMSHTTYRRLVNEMGSKVQRGEGGSAVGGFSSVSVHGNGGLITCIPCTMCPGDVIYLLTKDTWVLASMKDPVHIIQPDGQMIRAVSDDDVFEVRVGSYAQLGCRAPGRNARIAL